MQTATRQRRADPVTRFLWVMMTHLTSANVWMMATSAVAAGKNKSTSAHVRVALLALCNIQCSLITLLNQSEERNELI